MTSGGIERIYTGGKLWMEMEGWVMQRESTGRSLASVSIFGLNGSYTAVATLQKLLQLTCAYRCTHTVPHPDRDIVFKRVEIRETVERQLIISQLNVSPRDPKR